MTTVDTPDVPPELRIPGDRPRTPSVLAAHRGAALLAVAVVAVAVDLVWHIGADTVSSAALAAILAVLVVSGRGRPPAAAAGAAVLLVLIGAGTAVRTHGWLVATDWLVLLAALPIVAGLATGVSIRDLAPARAVGLVSRCIGAVLAAPVELARLIVRPDRRQPPHDPDRGARLLLGVILAVPVVLVVGWLLASADAVFASFLHMPFDVDVALSHVVITVAGAMLGVGLLVVARRSAPEPGGATNGLGHVELSVVLGGLVVVLGLFAAAQSVALVRGSEYIERTTGITYSDYARRGFFQLLFVAAIAGSVLVAVVPVARATSGRTRVRAIAMGELGVALTLVVVAVAVRRLDLYQEAYGLTMLRLACTWVAMLLGVAFVVIGLAIAGVGRSHRWLTGALIGLLLAGVVVANVLDPAATVARANVDRAKSTEWSAYDAVDTPADLRGEPDALDIGYLVSLGDDAVPVLLEHLDEMPAAVAAQVVRDVCIDRPEPRSVLDANRSASRAKAARQAHCPAVTG